MERYLVTGGAGFVGSNIAAALENERKAHVTVLDNFSSGNFKNLIGFGGDVVTGDICDSGWFDKAGPADAIFHQAAVVDTTVQDQRVMMAVNVDGFRNVLEFALKHGVKLLDLLTRPHIDLGVMAKEIASLKELLSTIPNRQQEIIESADIKIKYEGYIKREKLMADKINRLEDIKIKDKFNYNGIQSLSTEARQKLTSINPETIAQASRIPGVSPHRSSALNKAYNSFNESLYTNIAKNSHKRRIIYLL